MATLAPRNPYFGIKIKSKIRFTRKAMAVLIVLKCCFFMEMRVKVFNEFKKRNTIDNPMIFRAFVEAKNFVPYVNFKIVSERQIKIVLMGRLIM